MVENKKSTQHIVYLSLGSNVGEREKNIINALRLLKLKGIELTRLSSLYETEPVGMEDQPLFYNMVMQGTSPYGPEKLLKVIKEIELEIGRVWTQKWGPRAIDIDILFFNDQIINRDELIIPHPELHKRDFVLIPMAEIEPEFVHPILKKTIEEILNLPHQRKKVVWVKFLGAI